MKRITVHTLSLVLALAVVASAATMPERIVAYRPGNPGLFFSHTRPSLTVWQDNLDQTIWHGWASGLFAIAVTRHLWAKSQEPAWPYR